MKPANHNSEDSNANEEAATPEQADNEPTWSTTLSGNGVTITMRRGKVREQLLRDRLT